MKVGIIGTGLIGVKRARALSPEQVLVGAFDLNRNSLSDFSEVFKTLEFETVEALVDAVGPGGLVIVATNHASLAPLADKVLNGGCHILVEKPGARNFIELEKTVNLALSKNLVFRVGYNHRFHPAVTKLKKLTDDSVLGPVQLIRATYGHGGRPGYDKEWRASKEQSGGGELLDQGSHLLDLCQYLIGPIRLEFASLPTLYWGVEVEDNAFLYGTALQGAKLWLHASWTEWKNQFHFEVFFKTGKVEITGLGGSYGPETLTQHTMPGGLGIPETEEYVFDNPDDSWKLEMLDIYTQIKDGKFQGATGTDALQVLDLVGEAYRIDN
jgi:predicted dehydrogenase